MIKLSAFILIVSVSASYAADQAPAPAAPIPGDAEYRLCGNYYLGKGVPKNDVEAFAQCTIAAQKGNPNAMYNLGLFYQKGEGTAQNYNEAEKWFNSAALKGQSDAKYNLKQIALAKKGGMGVPPKPEASGEAAPKPAPPIDIAQYCLIAAQRGNPDAKCKSDLTKTMPAQAVAASSLDTVIAQAKAGNAQSQNDLGVIYRRGLQGVKKDPAQAQKLFESAASKGSTNGMMNLASMYKEGDVQQNLELSYAWYNLASGRLPAGDPKKAKAEENVKEVSRYLSNQQIGSSLQYVSKLDEKIPVINENGPAKAAAQSSQPAANSPKEPAQKTPTPAPVKEQKL